jgi:hypothetical protein
VIETNPAAATVKVVEPVTDPIVAVMFVEPVPELDAIPLEPVELLMIATLALDELHAATVVRSCVLVSV